MTIKPTPEQAEAFATLLDDMTHGGWTKIVNASGDLTLDLGDFAIHLSAHLWAIGMTYRGRIALDKLFDPNRYEDAEIINMIMGKMREYRSLATEAYRSRFEAILAWQDAMRYFTIGKRELDDAPLMTALSTLTRACAPLIEGWTPKPAPRELTMKREREAMQTDILGIFS